MATSTNQVSVELHRPHAFHKSPVINFRNCFTRARLTWLLAIITLLALAAILILSVHHHSGDPTPGKPVICDTDKCQRKVSSLLWAMNRTVDPCDNFYEFACGNAVSFLSTVSNVSAGPVEVIRVGILGKLINLTEAITVTDIEALKQLKILYDSCITFDRANLSIVPEFVYKHVASSNKPYGCILLLEQLMPFALTHKFILKYVDSAKLDDAREIFRHVQKAFHNLVSHLGWMDIPTRIRVKAKIDLMIGLIGHPDWLSDPDKVDACYKGLYFTNKGTLLDNLGAFVKWEAEVLPGLEADGLPVTYPAWKKISPVLADAYYNHDYNAVVIPMGNLEDPYFGFGTRASDYGALGFLFGHELVHGFAISAKPLNWLGLETDWWSGSAVNHFRNRTNCLVNQYDNYGQRDPANNTGDNITINGTRTLDENMSDNGGIRIAYAAYKMFIAEQRKPEPKLPGLENHSPEQIFFLSYAHSWCAYFTPSDLKLKMETGQHSPHMYRIIGSLSNSHEFAKAWECPRGSRMNPERKCVVWG